MADDRTERDVPTAENPVVEPLDDLFDAAPPRRDPSAADLPIEAAEAAEVDDARSAAPPASAADAGDRGASGEPGDGGATDDVGGGLGDRPDPDAGVEIADESRTVQPGEPADPTTLGGPGSVEPADRVEPGDPGPGVVDGEGTGGPDDVPAAGESADMNGEGDRAAEAVVVDPDATSAVLAPRRSALRRPLPWLAVGAGLLLAAVFTFAYVGAFVDPIDELRDLKIGVVDLDQPVTVAGETIDVGGQVVAATAADPSAAVQWQTYATREEVIGALERNELAGAIVMPAELSQRVAAIGTTVGGAPQASVEVLRNPGAGSLQPAVVDQAADALLAQLNAVVAQRLSATLTSLDVQVAPGNVTALATPVVATVADVPDIGDHGGRGLPPLYVAVMTTLTGLVGAIAIHTAVGAVAGRERIEVMGREIPVQRLRVRPGPRFWQEAALVGMLALGSAIVVPWVAVGLLGAHADRPFLAMPVVALGVLAAGWLTLLCVTALGVLGEVLVVLLITIFGVPSARGVYPAEALPGFFDFLGTFLPLRYLTDAMRAVFFFDGNDDAGLRTAIIVLWIWALGSLIVGGLVAGSIGRREARERRAAFATAEPPAAAGPLEEPTDEPVALSGSAAAPA